MRLLAIVSFTVFCDGTFRTNSRGQGQCNKIERFYHHLAKGNIYSRNRMRFQLNQFVVEPNRTHLFIYARVSDIAHRHDSWQRPPVGQKSSISFTQTFVEVKLQWNDNHRWISTPNNKKVFEWLNRRHGDTQKFHTNQRFIVGNLSLKPSSTNAILCRFTWLLFSPVCSRIALFIIKIITSNWNPFCFA